MPAKQVTAILTSLLTEKLVCRTSLSEKRKKLDPTDVASGAAAGAGASAGAGAGAGADADGDDDEDELDEDGKPVNKARESTAVFYINPRYFVDMVRVSGFLSATATSPQLKCFAVPPLQVRYRLWLIRSSLQKQERSAADIPDYECSKEDCGEKVCEELPPHHTFDPSSLAFLCLLPPLFAVCCLLCVVCCVLFVVVRCCCW